MTIEQIIYGFFIGQGDTLAFLDTSMFKKSLTRYVLDPEAVGLPNYVIYQIPSGKYFAYKRNTFNEHHNEGLAGQLLNNSGHNLKDIGYLLDLYKKSGHFQ